MENCLLRRARARVNVLTEDGSGDKASWMTGDPAECESRCRVGVILTMG